MFYEWSVKNDASSLNRVKMTANPFVEAQIILCCVFWYESVAQMIGWLRIPLELCPRCWSDRSPRICLWMHHSSSRKKTQVPSNLEGSSQRQPSCSLNIPAAFRRDGTHYSDCFTPVFVSTASIKGAAAARGAGGCTDSARSSRRDWKLDVRSVCTHQSHWAAESPILWVTGVIRLSSAGGFLWSDRNMRRIVFSQILGWSCLFFLFFFLCCVSACFLCSLKDFVHYTYNRIKDGSVCSSATVVGRIDLYVSNSRSLY